jgi:hypothetical protein
MLNLCLCTEAVHRRPTDEHEFPAAQSRASSSDCPHDPICRSGRAGTGYRKGDRAQPQLDAALAGGKQIGVPDSASVRS